MSSKHVSDLTSPLLPLLLGGSGRALTGRGSGRSVSTRERGGCWAQGEGAGWGACLPRGALSKQSWAQGGPTREQQLSSSKGQGASGRMTCHPQGQFQGPSSTLQSFVRGRPGVALEQHVTFCPPEVFLRSQRSVVAPCRVRETRECSNSFNSCSSSPASHLHCCHRPRECLGGTRTDSSHRGTDREDVGRTVLQAE